MIGFIRRSKMKRKKKVSTLEHHKNLAEFHILKHKSYFHYEINHAPILHRQQLLAIKTVRATFINFGTRINKDIDKMLGNTTTSYKIAGILKKPKMKNMNRLNNCSSQKEFNNIHDPERMQTAYRIRSI